MTLPRGEIAALAGIGFLGSVIFGITGFGAAAVVPAGLVGLWTAGHLFRRISREALLRVVSLMLLASGASLTLRALSR